MTRQFLELKEILIQFMFLLLLESGVGLVSIFCFVDNLSFSSDLYLYCWNNISYILNHRRGIDENWKYAKIKRLLSSKNHSSINNLIWRYSVYPKITSWNAKVKVRRKFFCTKFLKRRLWQLWKPNSSFQNPEW